MELFGKLYSEIKAKDAQWWTGVAFMILYACAMIGVYWLALYLTYSLA